MEDPEEEAEIKMGMDFGRFRMYTLTGACGAKRPSSITLISCTACATAGLATKKSYSLLPHVFSPALIMHPSMSCSHPVAVSCSGVPLKSPPMIQGPRRVRRKAATCVRMTRFAPSRPMPSARYMENGCSILPLIHGIHIGW